MQYGIRQTELSSVTHTFTDDVTFICRKFRKESMGTHTVGTLVMFMLVGVVANVCLSVWL